jgi:ABC-type phosphate/phosphonate transport system substrate-binding protein
MHGRTELFLYGLIAAPLPLVGCQSHPGASFLSLIGLQQKPVVLNLVSDPAQLAPGNALHLLNPFGPYEPLRAAMAKALDRPVVMDLSLPFQLPLALQAADDRLAIVTPVQYAHLSSLDAVRVLAISLDAQGKSARPALLIVSNRSEVRDVTGLRGRTVAFGPAGDSRTHAAALQLLKRNGLSKTDLSLEVLPILGSLRHMPDDRAAAQAVMNNSADAGFVDEAAWNAFAEADPRPGDPSRSVLRVIGRTVPLPDRLIIAGRKLNPGLSQRIESFLTSAGQRCPDALRPLAISGFAAPTSEIIDDCARLQGTDDGAPAAPSAESDHSSSTAPSIAICRP